MLSVIRCVNRLTRSPKTIVIVNKNYKLNIKFQYLLLSKRIFSKNNTSIQSFLFLTCLISLIAPDACVILEHSISRHLFKFKYLRYCSKFSWLFPISFETIAWSWVSIFFWGIWSLFVHCSCFLTFYKQNKKINIFILEKYIGTHVGFHS